MTPRPFGTLPSGETVEAYTLANASGASAQVLTYGGIVTSLRMPDRRGRMADVVLGFDGLGGLPRGPRLHGRDRRPHRGSGHGAARSRWTGAPTPWPATSGGNHLHGGRRGLDKRVWTAEPVAGRTEARSPAPAYTSPDGEEGYPGNVDIAVTYTLTAANEFIVESEATADRATPLSLAQHSYFNLAGEGSGEVLRPRVADPCGGVRPGRRRMALSDGRVPVAGRGADFGRPRRLGEALPDPPGGHGDVYLLRAGRSSGATAPRLAARVAEARTGRVLEVSPRGLPAVLHAAPRSTGCRWGRSGRRYGPLFRFLPGMPRAIPMPRASTASATSWSGRAGTQRRRTVYAFSTC